MKELEEFEKWAEDTVQSVTESFLEGLDGEDQAHLEKLKAEIESGKIVDIQVASYSYNRYSFGDLEKLGFAERKSSPASSPTSQYEWYEYVGPGKIRAIYSGNAGKTQVMQAGDTTPKFEADYS